MDSPDRGVAEFFPKDTSPSAEEFHLPLLINSEQLFIPALFRLHLKTAIYYLAGELMRILLVEDEEKVSGFVARGLMAERFAVDVTADGQAGLELATTYSYDLVILDLMLPKMDGTQVLRRLRSQNVNVPILILTARDAVSDKVGNFDDGADDYLTKPFAFAELLARVKALLRRGPVSRSSVVRVGDLELDRLSQQVKRAGKRIDLTSKEYSLLEYLMSNAGRVLSRTMIIEHVWDQSFDGITNIVDVYVRHLRSKVDDPFDQKLIHTVRGVGYSIGNGAHS
jgi:two-component system copper resistance phosphate regulon response regulator CusR